MSGPGGFMDERALTVGQNVTGESAPPKSRDRLFFAVYPDPQAAQRLIELAEALRARHGLHGKPIPANRVHITLHHLGDYCGLPEPLIETAGAAASRIAMSPFQVTLDCVSSFTGRGKRPCVLRSGDADANQALHALQDNLGARLRDAGLGRHVERRFTPHVTLLYDERVVRPESVQPIAWAVRRLALVHSLLGRGEHRVLAAWELAR